MNRKQAKELLPIIQAYVNGWEIEIRGSDEWIDLCDNPIFDGVPENYRIKPEPRVIYLNIYKDGIYDRPLTTAEAAREHANADAVGLAVKFIEVIE